MKKLIFTFALFVTIAAQAGVLQVNSNVRAYQSGTQSKPSADFEFYGATVSGLTAGDPLQGAQVVISPTSSFRLIGSGARGSVGVMSADSTGTVFIGSRSAGTFSANITGVAVTGANSTFVVKLFLQGIQVSPRYSATLTQWAASKFQSGMINLTFHAGTGSCRVQDLVQLGLGGQLTSSLLNAAGSGPLTLSNAPSSTSFQISNSTFNAAQESSLTSAAPPTAGNFAESLLQSAAALQSPVKQFVLRHHDGFEQASAAFEQTGSTLQLTSADQDHIIIQVLDASGHKLGHLQMIIVGKDAYFQGWQR